MKINLIHTCHVSIYLIIAVSFFVVSCESFFEPDQGLIVDEGKYFIDWNEYRAAELGLYALQQELVEQLVVLGELRADLLTVTENASRDLIDVATFQMTSGNKYASPLNFYKLIGACNRLSTQLEKDHPEVLLDTEVNIYDRLYGEVLCMRAWAYFNAVRIYKEVPYIWPSLTTVEDIDTYVSSSMTVINPMRINYGPDGYNNDTIYGDTVVLDRIYLDLASLADTIEYQLMHKVKAVGVQHNLVNGDQSWDVSIWNRHAKECLLGQIYLELGNYGEAIRHFDQILYYSKYNELIGSSVRYGLDSKFSNNKWRNIFGGIDADEHILTLWFNKAYQQKNQLQILFSNEEPNLYMLKPTRSAIEKWESQWINFRRIENKENPGLTYLDPEYIGSPGDFFRGNNVSYVYMKNGRAMINSELMEVLELKRLGNTLAVNRIMDGVDTVVYKYSIFKNSYDHDANFPIYRAAGIHLYGAEIYARWWFPDDNGIVAPDATVSTSLMNDGNYAQIGQQLGIRGRVNLGSGNSAISLNDPIYRHDPVTNEVIGYYDYSGNLNAKLLYLEDKIQDERAMELAFEGERFYDLMRVARRRGDPAYLADKVAAKFNHPMREQIREHLMIEDNWYLKLPE